MKVKALSHWLESLNIANAPWIQSDWESVLHLLSRLMYRILNEKIDQKQVEGSKKADKLSLTFQEAMQLGETSLGIPQFVVVCDTKQTIAESQLAIFTVLCAIKFNMMGSDSKYFRDIVFPFQVEFEMDVDDSSRYCAGCSAQTHFLDRCVLEGKVWHRRCLKCSVCKKQLYRGTFCGGSDASRFECVDHLVNQILHGDSMYRLEERALSPKFEKATPPPRPPPPKFTRDGTEDDDTMTISQKIESAIRENVCSTTPTKSSPEASEKNWEMLNYPTELNPFGSDEEEVEESGFDIDFDEKTKVSSNNPFSDDTDDAESDIEQVENPGDKVRVVSSLDNPSSPRSAMSDCGSSPRPEPKLRTKIAAAPATIPITPGSIDLCSEKEDDFKGNRPKSHPPPPPKPPRISQIHDSPATAFMKSSDSLCFDKKYIPPLPPVIYRAKKDSALPCGKTLNELSSQLRRLSCQLGQIETVGTRLESQILRAITNGKVEWKKSKVVEEYAANVERKCEALRIEAILARKYMDLFITVSHEELERQMKSIDGDDRSAKGPVPHASKAELTELLVQLMHMKNELLNIESVAAPQPQDTSCKSVKKSDSSSILKKGVKQTLKSLKKKL
ncbi:LIM domain-containing protein [Ditylenchus destructor]|nr:LIM domain-containing protein [Ditylenchus destructor]